MIDPQFQEISERVQQAAADKTSFHIQGGASKQFYTGGPDGMEVLDCSTYTGIVSYEPSELVITVRAGTTLRAVESMLTSRGQQFPFEPPGYAATATVGGMVACGFSGPRRAFNGAVRDAVLGIKLLNGKGEILEFGGQVLKNVAGYDVSRLVTGSFGTLGVILEVSLKVVPKPACELSFELPISSQSRLESLLTLKNSANNLSGLAASCDKITYRLAGSEESVRETAIRLGGDELPIDDGFWRPLKDQTAEFFSDPTPLWRVSVAPACPEVDLDGEYLADWGGALRWVKTNLDAEQVQARVTAVGGNALLFRSAQKNTMTLTTLSPAIVKLHQRIKASFDPGSVFNPGYLVSELS